MSTAPETMVNVRYMIDDVPAAVEFYTKHLGFSLENNAESLWQIWNPFWGFAALLRPDGHVGWMERRPTLAQLEAGVRKALGSIP
jgi:catechol 2,3-dioxygenase-like lactoylglutathione lyase family enzyme